MTGQNQRLNIYRRLMAWGGGGFQRPRLRQFLPHLLVFPAVALEEFFLDAVVNAAQDTDIYLAAMILLFGIVLVGTPISLVHALWRWFWSGTWRGAIWLLRPMLLALVPLMLVTIPFRNWGQTWDFERNLAERNRIVQQVLEANPAPMGEREHKTIALPEGSRRLSWHGRITLYGRRDGKSVDFQTHNGRYEYHTNLSPWLPNRYKRYDEHWCIFTW
jgi:hypothetical protein